MGYRKLDYEKLKTLTELVFEKHGYGKEDAATIADVLLKADLMGIESHGVQRLTLYPFGISIGRIKVDAKPEIVRETPLSVVIDAHDGMGQIASVKAMKMAIEKAKEHGMGFALVRNSNHYGIAGYYSMMAADEGLVGMSMTNTQALVVPTFGRKPLLGTNPIAFTVPAKPYPFHLDMSTSVVTAGKMEVYAKNKKPCPEGWLVDENGAVNTDAGVFVANRGSGRGGLLPVGGAGELHSGHKGYGMSMMVEIMTGIFAGGATSSGVRNVPERELCCHMFWAADPSMFNEDKEQIFKHLSEFLQMIRDSDKADGHDRIYTHGEKEFCNMAEVREHGVSVNDATYDEIVKLCEKIGIDPKGYLKEV